MTEQKVVTIVHRWHIWRFNFRLFETGWVLHYNYSHTASYWRKPVTGMPRFKLHVGKLHVEYY